MSQPNPWSGCRYLWFNAAAIKPNKLHFVYTAKMYSKNYECVITQVTKGALISSWKCTKSAPPGPAGGLQRSPEPLAGFKGQHRDKKGPERREKTGGRGKGKEGKGEGGERGRKGQGKEGRGRGEERRHGGKENKKQTGGKSRHGCLKGAAYAIRYMYQLLHLTCQGTMAAIWVCCCYKQLLN